MTFPIDLEIGAVRISSHLVFELLAFALGFRYYVCLRQRRGDSIPAGVRMWIVIGAALGALLGSRLVAALERPDFFLNPPTLLYYFTGKTIVGGLVGGLVGVELTKKILGESRSSGDLFTYPLIVAMMVGRVGCFLTGAADRTVGVASDLPWAIDQGSGYPQHPTSLYEIVFLALLWISIVSIGTRFRLKGGGSFRLFMIGYLSFRLLVECIKPRHALAVGLSAIQVTCVLALVYYTYSIWVSRRSLGLVETP